MPLPPALVERLKKRGLVNKSDCRVDDVEEVFAESYDEEGRRKRERDTSANKLLVHDEQSGYDYLLDKISLCPNKINPFHKCVGYCFERWGEVKFTPDSISYKRRLRMLRRYPLPAGWFEVADPISGRFYYWNVDTDKVSWLAPLHPHARLSRPDFSLRQETAERESNGDTFAEGSADRRSGSVSDNNCSRSRSVSSDDECEYSDNDYQQGRKRTSDKHRTKRGLDPMDPASYSDAPRGSWTSGMDQRGKAKTGVDSTASGPLFQQRPYPSPGDVLRQNKQLRN